jgi:hypothetical protein
MINSKILLTLSFIFSLITFISVSKASDQFLATFSSDEEGESYQLAASTKGEDQALTRFTITKVLGDRSYKNKEVSINNFIRDGLSLYQARSQSLTKIYGPNLSEQEGGIIELESFIKSSDNNEKFYQLELSKDNAKWGLLYQGKPITKIHATLGVTGVLDLIME